MATRKKKRTALPRVTVLAMSRKELMAYVNAMETFAILVADLKVVAERLLAASKGRKATKAKPEDVDDGGSMAQYLRRTGQGPKT